MMTEQRQKTAKRQARQKRLRVPVLAIEEAEIKNKANDAGLPVASYLHLGLGYQVPSVIDNKQVDHLLKINGDLGRLGGLIKLWLTSNGRTTFIGKSKLLQTLDQIRGAQNRMLDVILKLRK